MDTSWSTRDSLYGSEDGFPMCNELGEGLPHYRNGARMRGTLVCNGLMRFK